ncbi:hypothetical protein T03_1239, partial [Trichinella britovi]
LPPPQNLLAEMKVAALDVDSRKRSLQCRDKGSLKVANERLRLKDNP